MCGILAIRSLDGKSVNHKVKEIYFKQKSRGQEGFGFVDVNTGEYHRARFEHQILKVLKDKKRTEILFHNRKPTSTHNDVDMSHPISSGANYSNKYFLAHNGSVEDYHAIYEDHVKNYAVQYATKYTWTDLEKQLYYNLNDSETLLHELVLILTGKKNVHNFKIKGPTAFVLLEMDDNNHPLNMYWGRNYGRPLQIYQDNHIFTLSSEGQGESVEPDKLFQYNYAKGVISDIVLNIPGAFTYQRNCEAEDIREINDPYSSTMYYRDTPTSDLLDERNNLLTAIDNTKQLIKEVRNKDDILEMSEELETYTKELEMIDLELSIRSTEIC